MIHVSETFTSWQGTGHLLGTRMHFVRFAGCSVLCPIRSECDEQGSLTRRGATQRDVESLVEEALDSGTGWMHITGGEPTDQSDGLQELVMLARASGLKVHIQSSGVRTVPCQWDWLTTDPLKHTFGQELVLVNDGSWDTERLDRLRQDTKFWCYYLTPLSVRGESSGLAWEDQTNTEETLELAADAGWDMTLQAHKVWAVK